ncbi:MAG TPA: DUF362 domain-containing protein [Kiritimatiellia bacterium]|nr:DUF362 domain-containing protein [Kiritimatiellia bacterium]HRZ12571.1 DUF362 domain-containing protein [Kiritimatiellia bacterium]HSA17649.1 DUF362 domain-containing protein [Kiritimatiellia bacterium]
MPLVAVEQTTPSYPDEPPFHPGERYPEAPFPDTAGPNPVYAAVRRLLMRLGMDEAHAGSPDWNPLGAIVRPGDTVVLKPNFVISRNLGGGDLFAVVTHPSVLRALADYCFIALRGRGRLVIADAPEMGCDWDELMRALRLDAVADFYRRAAGFPLEICDLRNFALVDNRKPAYAHNRKPLPGDPAGSTVINLGRESAFYGMDSARYYGADYDRRETIRHHHGETHEYCISNTVLRADALISVPKLKTHKKVGVTLNLKGLVGINTNKNYLIHYRLGTPRTGGDQAPDALAAGVRLKVRVQRWLFDRALARQTAWGDAVYAAARGVWRRLFRPFVGATAGEPIVDAGNWHRNDSAWRMTSDMARILFFADRDGVLRDRVQRRMFCLVDGIVGGEGDGPLAPTARPSGCLVGGENPLAVDLVASRLMGFDPARIRQFDVLKDRRRNFGFSAPEEIRVAQGERVAPGAEYFSARDIDPRLNFQPHSEWKGHIEIASNAEAP